MVERFVMLAKPRLLQLLHLRVPHIYDDTPGDTNSTVDVPNAVVTLKLTSTHQPYGDMMRFTAEDKEMGFVVNPGLVPLAKAILLDIRGRQYLATRRIASRQGDRGVVACMDGFGARVMMYHDADGKQSHVVWECLFGVG